MRLRGNRREFLKGAAVTGLGLWMAEPALTAQRQSANDDAATQTGSPRAPARCATAVSALTTSSRCCMAAAVSANARGRNLAQQILHLSAILTADGEAVHAIL